VTEAHRIFTHASVVALIETVAGELLHVAARWRRDRWYFLGSERRLTAPPLPPGWTWSEEAIAGFSVGAEIKHRVTGSQAVSPSWRTAGLSAHIRVRWFPDPRRPKNTAVFLLIDFGKYLPLTEDDLRRREAEVPALIDPSPEAYESREAWEAFCAYEQEWQGLYGEKAQALAEVRKHFYTPQQTMTTRAWLDHAHNPYKAAIRSVPRALNGTPGALAKLQAQVLDKEREARTQRIAKGGAPFAWNWLCVSPQSSAEDLAFWLLLYLCQAQMIEETDDVLAFETCYLRPFCRGLREAVGETRHADNLGSVAGDPSAGIIYEVFSLLKKHYAFQEHWKGGPAYIWRVVRHLMKKSGPKLVVGIDHEAAEAIQQRKRQGRRAPIGRAGIANPLLTVDAAVEWLAAKGVPVSRETLYRWIREKKITHMTDERGRLRLDDTALAQAASARPGRSRLTCREIDDNQEEET
jgi:hypothetical protein